MVTVQSDLGLPVIGGGPNEWGQDGASYWSRCHPGGRVVAVVVSCFGERVQRRSRTCEATEVVVAEGEAEQVGEINATAVRTGT